MPLISIGVAIMVAVVIVVVVGSANDWQKERQFKKLNEKKEDRTVKVIRDGTERVINIKVCQQLYTDYFYSSPVMWCNPELVARVDKG